MKRIALTAALLWTTATSLVGAVASNDRIVFDRGLDRIWVMSADGTQQRQLTSRWSDFPVWSPDRRWIAFTSAKRGKSAAAASQEIWLMRPDGSDKRQLTHLYPAQAIGLSWSPDGTRLAFGRGVKPPEGIWLIDIRSGRMKPLTHDGADGTPVWSPDGKHIVFTKSCCTASGPQWKGPSTLFKMNADGTGVRRLLEPPAKGCNDDDPSWSPDSHWIVFDRCVLVGPRPIEGPWPGRTDLWVVRANGTGLRLIRKDASSPSWSPDGRWIVFVGSAGVGKNVFDSLYKVQPTGSDPIRLTYDSRGDEQPNW